MSDSKKVALVFGVSGGIGSSLYSNLKRKKFEVYGFSRTTESNNNNVISEKYLKDLSLKFIEQNIKIKIFINSKIFYHLSSV